MPERTAQKKPVQVQVWTFDPNDGPDVAALLVWCQDATYIRAGEHTAPMLIIKTLEGDHRAQPGDVIIRGVHGEFYPCTPDIFVKTYDEVGA